MAILEMAVVTTVSSLQSAFAAHTPGMAQRAGSKQQAFCSFSFCNVRGETPALFCTHRTLSPQGRIQGWEGQALTVWHSCMLMSESPFLFFSATLRHPLHKPEGCHTACSPTSVEHFTTRWRYLSTDPRHLSFQDRGCSAMWQVAGLPLNFPDASQDSQAENQVLLSSLRLLWRSVLWPLAGCRCRDTSASRLEASWSDCALVKTLSQPCLWWQSWTCAFVTPSLRWLAEPVKYVVVPNVSSFTVAALKHESLYSWG